MALNIIYPTEGYIFANADETEFYSALILAPNDSIENYYEVKIEDMPEETEPEEEYIDPEDVDPYIPPDTNTVPLTRAELTIKIAQLEEELALTRNLLGLDQKE